MTSVELDQFLVDHHREDEAIEVNSCWLQLQLMHKLQLERDVEYYPATREALKARIEIMQEKLDLYKEILEVYRNRKVLNVSC